MTLTHNSYVYFDDQSTTCNCACSVCMSGGCCLWNPSWDGARQWRFTGTSTSTSSIVVRCGGLDHNFIVLDAKKRLVVCSKCGESRTV